MSKVESGTIAYHAEFSGRAIMGVLPLPAMGKIHVSIADGRPEPVLVTIPVTIWPSFPNLIVWSLFLSATIIGLRWREALVHSRSIRDALPQLSDDVPFVVEILFLGFMTALCLRLLGWLMILAEADTFRE